MQLAPNIPIPLDTIRYAYAELGHLVNSDLCTQLGDAACLGECKRECLNLLQLVQQHTRNIPPEEYWIIEEGIQLMVLSLDNASQTSNDVPDMPPVAASQRVYTGQPGHPCVDIDPDLLRMAVNLEGGPTSLAAVFNCAPMTIQHRALELRIVEPGPPVYVEYEHANGTITRIYRSSTRAVSDIDDPELDQIIASILEAFPLFGH
ncbi:unnamed protein product [Cyclocybe aegerita]|uniref:Uncharacterized protein n=1 Tax=Cyclocybe aegerita TaxID=1973307 RepID=A0A8S0WLU2_CYCAE|nr:unnamed protein product [Cyclocybe aegerita]